jgi:nucleobase:cation symporter-1, NCS1 family
MASSDKSEMSTEKTQYPISSAVEPVEAGKVHKLKSLKYKLEVRQEESTFAVTKNASNADFDPIPPSKRTWNWGAYVAYWMADAWAVSNWEVGKPRP